MSMYLPVQTTPDFDGLLAMGTPFTNVPVFDVRRQLPGVITFSDGQKVVVKWANLQSVAYYLEHGTMQ